MIPFLNTSENKRIDDLQRGWGFQKKKKQQEEIKQIQSKS